MNTLVAVFFIQWTSKELQQIFHQSYNKNWSHDVLIPCLNLNKKQNDLYQTHLSEKPTAVLNYLFP